MPHVGPPIEGLVPLSHLLQEGVGAYPDDKALISLEGDMTWSELDRASIRLATHYLAMGLKPGDRIASLMPNRIGLPVHYIACFRAGLVLTPLNYRYTAPEIDHALEVSEASAILAHHERADDIATSKASTLPLGVITYGAGASDRLSYEQLLAEEPPPVSLPELEPTAPAAIFFTSGSTGPAKGVTHSRDTLAHMFASAAAAFELTTDDILLPGSSLSHIGGFTFSFSALSKGVPVVIPRTFDHDEMMVLLRHARPTILSMLPTALFHLIREHDVRPSDFESLRMCRSAGDKVAEALEKGFTALAGFPIDEGYGMTEIGLATISPPSGLIKRGSVGQPHPGFILSIRDEEWRELSPGTLGRLWVKTPSRTIGYWNNPDASAEVVREEWLDTGDVMRADEDGYLWFHGRKKQIIVHDGSNICPQEVEGALLEHPAVESVGVVGIHDSIHGENVRAYVEIKKDATQPTARELIAFARERVGYKAPEEIVIIDEMPLNPTGKVDRTKLKMLAAGDHAHHV